MRRYDFCRHADSGGFLLNVQADQVIGFRRYVVVPLLPAHDVPKPVKRLNPVFVIAGQNYVMATHLLSSVPSAILGQPSGTLKDKHFEIIDALDMLFSGF